jgi:hypothetical protein
MVQDSPKWEQLTKLPSGIPAVEDARQKAEEYIQFYDWVSTVDEQYLGVGVEGVLFIFLFKISSTRSDVDPWVWVIIGDLPPAYITCENAKTPGEALDGYIGAMEDWVDAARHGRSVAELIPVNVPATVANAELLDKRLKFLDREVLPSLLSAN